MVPHHILTTPAAPDEPAVVTVIVDLAPEQVRSALQALRTTREVRFRTAEMSADDVVAMREITALTDELADLEPAEGIVPVSLSVARLGVLSDAVHLLVEAAHLEREGDEAARPAAYGLVDALDDIRREAITAALAAAQPVR